jgi:hypothetical protein
MPGLRSVVPYTHLDVLLSARIVDAVPCRRPQKFNVHITGEFGWDFIPVVVGSVIGLIVG